MTDQAIEDLTAFIAKQGDHLMTDSRAVALAFGKQHKNVLRNIEKMRLSESPVIASHYGLNFEPVDFIDVKGQVRPMYRMTEKGMAELAMSFTGDKARITRIRFLNAFETMANRLASQEKSITQQLHDLERREMPSQLKGRVGSILMNQRRKEKPTFKKERAELEALAQPNLPLAH